MILTLIRENWIDLIIILIIIYFIAEAFRHGFWVLLADFIGFLLSLLIALWGNRYAAEVLESIFTLSRSMSKALGFLITAGLTEAFLVFVSSILIKKIPYKYWKQRWSKILAVIPAVGEALVLVSFLLTLVLTLPIYPRLKSDIEASFLGGYLVRQTTGIEYKINDVFGGLIQDSLTYMTVHPNSAETIPLVVEYKQLNIDSISENKMLNLVNEERRQRSIAQLMWNREAVDTARKHARDMWERKFFGHISLDGDDVVDRLKKDNLEYFVVGENLALAPTIEAAHAGLMNSEGHRKNILDISYRKIAVGVIDNGVYGKIFVQIFTD